METIKMIFLERRSTLKALSLLLMLSILCALITFKQLQMTKTIIQNIAAKVNFNVTLLVALLVVLYLLRIILDIGSSVIKEKTKRELIYYLNEQGIRNLLRVDLQTLESSEFQERSYLAKEAVNSVKLVIDSFQPTMTSLFTLLILIFFMFSVNVYIGLGTILSVGIYIYLLLKSSHNQSNIWTRYLQIARRFNYLSNVLMAQEFDHERKLFDFHDWMDKKFSTTFDIARRDLEKNGFQRMKAEVVIDFVSTVCHFAILIALFACVTKGYVSVALIIVSIYVFESVMLTTSSLSQQISVLSLEGKKISECLDLRAFSIVNENAEERTIKGSPTSTYIELKDVYFKYPNTDQYILKGVNLVLNGLQHVALVGENGSGKSTLVKLLTGLYKPTQGSIWVNGIEIGDDNRFLLHQVIGAVFQDSALFNMSLRENILLENRAFQFDEEEILDLFEVNGIANRLGAGYETTLGNSTDCGINLSGGENQKICIARLLLQRKELAVLDEPNSALDPLTEYKINSLIDRTFRDKGVLFVTHRLHCVEKLDCIYVIKNGCIYEHGSHTQLVGANGYYNSLYQTQRRLYEIS